MDAWHELSRPQEVAQFMKRLQYCRNEGLGRTWTTSWFIWRLRRSSIAS